MVHHEKQLNEDKDNQRTSHSFISARSQHQQRLGVDVFALASSQPTSNPPPATTSPASSNSSSSVVSSIIDPPPPYVLSRSHSSNTVSDSPTNTNTHIRQRYTATQPLGVFTPSETPIFLSTSVSAPGSGTVTPKATPVSAPLSTNAYATASASGVSLRKSLSSVDDILWADMRRRRGNYRASYANAHQSLRYKQKYEDEELPNANMNENDDEYADEHLYVYTSSDNDHGHDYNHDDANPHPISTGSRSGMGETETEMDEPSRCLPTSRKFTPPQQYDVQSTTSLLDLISGPSSMSPLSHNPSTPLLVKLSQSRLVPILFELFKLLSVVPAGLGFIWHLWCFSCAVRPGSDTSLGRIRADIAEFSDFQMTIHNPFDHFVCLLWTLLTAHQCLALTTGLQLRWRAYYPSHATLIRLLALQAICWPATQFTLIFVDHEIRPVVCWALIGSTTCFSRAVQIWVVSNLKIIQHGMKCGKVALGGGRSRGRTRPFGLGGKRGGESGDGQTLGQLSSDHDATKNRTADTSRVPTPDFRDGFVTIKWVPRRWDWPLVIRTCAVPAAIVYFVMAWVGELRREVGRWSCQKG